MKHLIVLYNIYFIMLMVVPCNHTVLYSDLMEKVFGIHLQQHCTHSQHHATDEQQQDNSKQHHSCTPFCACGIAHFVLNAPPFQLTLANTSTTIYQGNIIRTTIWAATSNEHGSLMINDIWHPPQRV